MLDYLNLAIDWVQSNYQLSLGIILTVIGLYLTISELIVYYRHDSSTENLMLWLMCLIAGVSTILTNDFVLGILLGISLLMVVQTIQMWDTPVWGQLFAATTASYIVILAGRLIQYIYNTFIDPTNTDEFFFATAFNVAFFVFLAVAFYFFGKKFILVSRFSSPQIVYLFLFGIVYVVIANVFPKDANDFVVSYNYLNLGEWRRRVLFADFGTFEALIIVMVFMYFISGWLLSTLFGVEEITDDVLLEKVRVVANKMGIEEEIKVGFVQAPILNAFAYGPWFDKRVAFISNDIDDFTDADIRGIVGHELAHAANHHVLILLGLSIFELLVKKVLLLPATTLDYTFTPETASSTVSFFAYYIISYGLFAFILIFVRMLEGHADKKTLEAGYGEDLSKALYRLEGFYNGVASDFGISVNLLTDRTYTIEEKRRFTAQAARNLYGEVLQPSRGSAFANIFQSHPRTAYRIASIVDEDLDPIKGAFLSYRLVGFGLRKGAIEQLNKVQEEYKTVIDNSYLEDYGEDALDEVRKFNPWEEPYFGLINQEVIAYDQFNEKLIVGKFEELEPSNTATSPLYALVNGEKINLARSLVKKYHPGERYVLKNGQIVTLKGHKKGKKDKGIIIEVEREIQVERKGKVEREIKVEDLDPLLLGEPLSFLDDLKGKEIMYYNEAVSQLATLNDYNIGDHFFEGELVINDETIPTKDLIISFPPLGFEVRKSKRDKQLPLLKYLIDKKVMLYTKQNFDVSLAGRIYEITEESIKFRDADGDHEIEFDNLEYIMFAEQTVEIVRRDQVTEFTKLGIWWSNRKEFNYIF